MLELPAKTNGLLQPFFAKPNLVPIREFQSICFCCGFPKLVPVRKSFYIEVEHLRSILKWNNSPVNIIDEGIKKCQDKLYVPKQIVLTVPKRELLVVVPFLGKFSLNLRKSLYKLVSKTLPKYNIKVTFSPNFD